MGAGAIALRVPSPVHLGVAAAVFAAVAVAAYPFLLRGPDHDDHPADRRTAGPPGATGERALLALVAIAIAGADGRGRRKFVGHAVPGRGARRARGGRRARLRRAARVPCSRTGARRPDGGPLRRARGGPGRRTADRGGHGRGPGVPQGARTSRASRPPDRRRHRHPRGHARCRHAARAGAGNRADRCWPG